MFFKKTKIILFSLAIFFGFFVLSPGFARAATFTSTQTGNFTIGTTWGGACSSSCTAGTDYPNTGDAMVVANGHTVTLTGTTQVTGITVNNGGILGFNTRAVTNNGGLTLNGQISGTTATLSMAGANQNITGTGTYSPTGTITMTGGATFDSSTALSFGGVITTPNTKTTTNNGTVSITGTAAAQIAGAGSWVQGATGILNYKGDTITVSTFTATAAGNIVNYNDTSSSQTVLASTYDILKISDSGQIASLGGTTTINSTGNINVVSGTLQMNTRSITNNGTTTVAGTIKKSSTTGTPLFVGLITVNSGGTWDTSDGNDAFEIRGGITNNTGGTFTAGSGTFTFSTNSQNLAGGANMTFGGVFAISSSMVITNNNTATITITGNTTGGNGTSKWTQGANSTVKFGAAAMATGTIDASTNTPNTVEYDGTATLKAVHYYNVTINSGGSSVTTAATTIDNNLVVNGGYLQFATTDFTVTGTTTLNNSGQINSGSSIAGTKTFTGLITLNGTSRFNASLNSSSPNVTISAGIVQNSSDYFSLSDGTNSLTGNLSGTGTGGIQLGHVSTGVTIASGTTTNNYTGGIVDIPVTLALTGNWAQGNGSTLRFSGGTPFSGSGTFSASTATNTVTYNYAGAQTVKDPNGGTAHTYSNLVLTNNGVRTLTSITTTNDLILSGNVTVSLPGNFTVGGNLWAYDGTSLTQGANTLAITGNMTVAGTYAASSSAITVGGNLNVAPSAIWTKSTGIITFGGSSNTKTISQDMTDYIGYWKLDETTTSAGATVTDSGGNSYTGTPGGTGGTNNLPQPSTSVPSAITFSDPRSLDFDGTDDYVDISSAVLQTFNNSISVWIYPTAAGSSTIIGSNDSNVAGLRIGSDLSLNIGTPGNGVLAYTNADAVTLNAWNHVVAVWPHHAFTNTGDGENSGQVKFYVNGVSVTNQQDNTMHWGTSTSLNIGRSPQVGGSDYFTGKIDDVRIFSHCLSATEASNIYASSVYSGPLTDIGSVTVGDASISKVLNLGGNITLDNLIVTNASTFGMTNSSYNLNLNGNLTLNATSTFTKAASGTGKIIVYGTSSVLTDSNATKQDLGPVQISGYTEDPIGFWKFDEGTGTAAADSSGNGKTGTLSAGAAYSSTVAPTNITNPYSVTLDGINDYVDMGDYVVHEVALPLSVAAWVKVSDLSAGAMIFANDGQSTYSGVDLNINSNGSVEIDYGDNTGNGAGNRRSFNTTNAITTNVWYHIVGVIRGATDMSIYINGVDQAGSYSGSSGSIAYTGNTLKVGHNDWGYTFTPTLVDDLRFYSRGLSAAEAAKLAGGNGMVSSLTLATSAKITSLTIDSGQTFSGGGTYTLTLTGSGAAASRPFIVNGTFTPSTGTIAYAGTSATEITSTTYNGLSLSPAGTPTYTLGTATSQTINVADLTIGDGSNAVAVNHATYDPTLNITGNLLISASAGTFTKSDSPATITLKPVGSKTWTDNTNQDIGVVVIGSGTSTPKITLGGTAKATSVTISASHELDLSSYTLSLTKTSSTPFVPTGTFTPSTGTINYIPASSSTITVSGTTYYNVTFNSSSTTFNLGNHVIANGNVTITAGTLDATASSCIADALSCNITLSGNWSNSGTFTARTGRVIFAGVDQTIAGTTTFYDLAKQETTNNSTNKTLTFPSAVTTTIGGTLTLDGLDANDKLLIVASTPSSAATVAFAVNSQFSSTGYLTVTDNTATDNSVFITLPITPANSTDGGNTVGWFPTAYAFDQKHFRFYRDNAGLNSADYYAAQDTSYNVGLANTFRLRIETANTGSGAGNVVRRLEFREDSGTWTQITTGTNNVRLSNSANFTDAAATTTRLTAVGTFAAGQGKDTGSDTSSLSLTNAYYTEDEYSLILQSTAAGHSYEFRITNAGVAFDTYTVTPAISTPDSVAPIPSGFNPATAATIKTATPTIYYNLDENGDCKASTTNNSYASMSGADCTGDGSTSGTCLMPSLGSNGSKTIYFACQDMFGNQDTSGTTHSVTYTLTLSSGTASSGLIIKGGLKLKGNVIVK